MKSNDFEVKTNNSNLFFKLCCHGIFVQLGQLWFHASKKDRNDVCQSWYVGYEWWCLLSPPNALRWGYSNPAVVPCVRAWFRPSMRGPCEYDRDYTVAYFFVKLGRHVNHYERMNPIDIGGQSSKVKVTMDIYGKKFVNTIATKLLCASCSNLVDVLAMVRGWTLLILEVRGQRSRSQWTYMEITLWTR